MPRTLLVDDHKTLRCALRFGLSLIPELEVIGEAVDGVEAVLRAQELRPDLVVMDVNMPRTDGITATRRLRDKVPDAVVIVYSLQDDPRTKELALEAGAVAFVAKTSGAQSLVDEILRSSCTHGARAC